MTSSKVERAVARQLPPAGKPLDHFAIALTRAGSTGRGTPGRPPPDDGRDGPRGVPSPTSVPASKRVPSSIKSAV